LSPAEAERTAEQDNERNIGSETTEDAMEVPHDAVLLRIFTTLTDKWGLNSLYMSIIEKAHEMNLAGATVLRGQVGFGHSAKLHETHIFRVTQDLPVVIEIVDNEDKINAFLPVLDQMMESGLVTLEAAKVLQYGKHRAGLLQRIRDQFGMGAPRQVIPPPDVIIDHLSEIRLGS
jgi:hypothetical protein